MGNLTPEEIARNGAINAENIAKQAGEQAKDYGKRHWYPSVDADGNLTWEKSKSDAKPRIVNIRGPQGTSGIIGEVSDLTVVNSLDGGESEPGSVKVLAAEQGKILNKKIEESKNSFNEKLEEQDSKIINKIAFEDLDLDEGRIAQFMFSMSSTRCLVTYKGQYNVGVLEMLSDSSGHVLTQIFTTQFNILNDGVIEDNAHKDDAFYQYTRFYAFSKGSHDQTLKTWSKWKLVYSSEDIESIKESIKKLEEGGIGGSVKSFSRVDLEKNLSSITISEAEGPESSLRLEEGANVKIEKGTNGAIKISADYSSSGGDGIIIIQ